jgi:sugar O-acyltransferase (sialic acid O-acetyltransferase NeuD family)
MAKVVIFGIRDFAELAHFYLTHDSDHEVVGFSVSADIMPTSTHFLGLPVIPFDNVETYFPIDEVVFFAPLSPRNMNRNREEIYKKIKAKGYGCISYVSSKATIFSTDIGENCFILENNTIQPFTKIGNNVVMWSGNHIGHHGVIADNVMFTSHVVMSGHCEIGLNSFFGINSSIRDGLKVAEGTFLTMSSALTNDSEPWSVYKGNPAIKLKVPSTRINF